MTSSNHFEPAKMLVWSGRNKHSCETDEVSDNILFDKVGQFSLRPDMAQEYSDPVHGADCRPGLPSAQPGFA